ncbi:MAG: AAA family ATPase [Proteobacteria bacterium]|jgi:superfamily I DNA/RNA helicase|nr:AAA family ATPase [Pseudomonadota bacterium]
MTASVMIARQFYSALGQLSANDQARANVFVMTFAANPATPSISLERLTRALSKNVWSGRVSQDLRVILYKDGETWAMVYVDHHKPAYEWAERHEVDRHTITGALHIIESVETVRKVDRIIEVPVHPDAPPIFGKHDDGYLLSLGVPESWLPTLRRVCDDGQLLVVCEQLPDDVSERLLTLADGGFVTPPRPVPLGRPAIESSDTQRRFFLVEDTEGLAAALEAPMERWIAFLHPSQREMVERAFSGPAKVSGSAGTGKTVVAMHRARHLARRGNTVLLTSFVSTLCENIQSNIARICNEAERARITVSTVHKQALSIVRKVEPRVQPASEDDVNELLGTLRTRHAPAFDASFVRSEWDNVVRLQGIESWDGYRQAHRTGRGRGLAVKERKVLWQVFGEVINALAKRQMRDWTGLCIRAEELLTAGSVTSPFSAVVVDEVQDLRSAELRFLQALCAREPGNLMVCGDAGQRIYPGGFTLKALGIDVRGRSTVLRINYRTTEQIRRLADRIVGVVADDMDGGEEARTGTRSLLRGPEPALRGYPSFEAELAAGITQIRSWIGEGLQPDAIGVFARTGNRAKAAGEELTKAALPWRLLSDKEGSDSGTINVGTMHRAKGLEFKAVLVLDCSRGVVPSPAVLRYADDPQDREAAEARERRLLYVAMTRARDELIVSWNGKPSGFIEAIAVADVAGAR